MFAQRVFKCLPVVLALSFGSCASVDQFGSRINDGNTNSQNALNEEILLNVLRASRYQSPNFMGISQITGGQTETLTTGLPTITFGQVAAAQQVYQISNSLQSGVTGGYQSSPLISTSFQHGMLSPVSPRIISLLINSHPREIVFFLLVESIVVTNARTREVARLINEPDRDGASAEECRGYRASIFPGTQCTYTKFANLMHALERSGLTAELIASATPTATNATPSSVNGLPGRLCFDPALSFIRKAQLPTGYEPVCGQPLRQSPTSGQTKTVTTSKKTTQPGVEDTATTTVAGIAVEGPKRAKVTLPYQGIGNIEVAFEIRSPLQVLNYLGTWQRYRGTLPFPYYKSGTAMAVLPPGEPYLNIIAGSGPACYTSTFFAGERYCVPHQSLHTAMLFDIFESLRNLNISPTDLNSAFTVRLAQ